MAICRSPFSPDHRLSGKIDLTFSPTMAKEFKNCGNVHGLSQNFGSYGALVVKTGKAVFFTQHAFQIPQKNEHAANTAFPSINGLSLSFSDHAGDLEKVGTFYASNLILFRTPWKTTSFNITEDESLLSLYGYDQAQKILTTLSIFLPDEEAHPTFKHSSKEGILTYCEASNLLKQAKKKLTL